MSLHEAAVTGGSSEELLSIVKGLRYFEQASPVRSMHFHGKTNSTNRLQAPDSPALEPLYKIREEATGVG